MSSPARSNRSASWAPGNMHPADLTHRNTLSAPSLPACQGRTYLCKRLDLGERLAVVRPADLKYYTKTRDFCDVHVIGGRALLPHNVSPSAACGAARCRVAS